MVLQSENIPTIPSNVSLMAESTTFAAQQLQEYGLCNKTIKKMDPCNCLVSNSTTVIYDQKSCFVNDSGLKKTTDVDLRFGLWQGNDFKLANKN